MVTKTCLPAYLLLWWILAENNPLQKTFCEKFKPDPPMSKGESADKGQLLRVPWGKKSIHRGGKYLWALNMLCTFSRDLRISRKAKENAATLTKSKRYQTRPQYDYSTSLKEPLLPRILCRHAAISDSLKIQSMWKRGCSHLYWLSRIFVTYMLCQQLTESYQKLYQSI